MKLAYATIAAALLATSASAMTAPTFADTERDAALGALTQVAEFATVMVPAEQVYTESDLAFISADKVVLSVYSTNTTVSDVAAFDARNLR